jgi:hypothetical protein
MAGLGDSADFAHQFHIAFARMVSGACIFSGQPFNCAIAGNAGDSAEWHAKILANGGAASSTNDHCKSNPDVVDVGSLVDYPRRHCGQNPISVQECFDDVNFVKRSRVFLFRGANDTVSKPGAVENVDGLLAQLITDPSKAIKREISTFAFGHVVPLKSTPFVGNKLPAGYDGPAECLRHVYDMMPGTLRPGNASASNWLMFNQTEFTGDKAVGFQEMGWVYVPERCQDINQQGPGSAPCKLLVRPGKCTPPALDVAPDVAEFANYAQANAIVLLSPCLGGGVDRKAFPHASDIEQGKLDVYGQLDHNYVQQSAPHMRAIGKMVRRVLGLTEPNYAPANALPLLSPPPPALYDCSAPPAACAAIDAEVCCGCKGTGAFGSLWAPWSGSCPAECMSAPKDCEPSLSCPGVCLAPVVEKDMISKMPTLQINTTGIMTAGCSNTADFSEQFHVAFSSLVTGSCIFSGMPYHSAVTRFPNDYMVAKSKSTAAGIHCMGCDANGTLTYDHAKNHPLNVDLDMLHDYAENPPAVRKCVIKCVLAGLLAC